MNEAEWLTYTDPMPMLEFLRGRASDRKLRLFAVACCRRVWQLLTDTRSQRAVEVAELYADGLVGASEIQAAFTDAHFARLVTAKAAGWYLPTHGTPAEDAALAAVTDQAHFANAAACAAVASVESDMEELTGVALGSSQAAVNPITEQVAHCRMIHDICGPFLFHPVSVDPAWLTSTVLALAQTIYDDRAFDRMPILADALEDSGCTNTDILGHCRGPGPHVRGCWVVDLLLGKE